MKLAAHMLVFNVNRFVVQSIESLLPHVDRLYLAYPSRPFGYNATARESLTNPTPLTLIQPFQASGKVQVLLGDWMREEETRNECLEQAHRDGMDWLLTIDADEFYTEQGWERIQRFLLKAMDEENVTTNWYNFFRSSQYILVDERGKFESENASFALRCNSSLRFANRRQPNATRRVLLDVPCYHYGYVMTDEEMLNKLTTWSHTNDFDCMRWYRLKWLDWNESIRNLHPVRPAAWPKAVPFPLEQPNFASAFALEHRSEPRSARVRLENAWYDFRADNLERLRKAKRWVISS